MPPGIRQSSSSSSWPPPLQASLVFLKTNMQGWISSKSRFLWLVNHWHKRGGRRSWWVQCLNAFPCPFIMQEERDISGFVPNKAHLVQLSKLLTNKNSLSPIFMLFRLNSTYYIFLAAAAALLGDISCFFDAIIYLPTSYFNQIGCRDP